MPEGNVFYEFAMLLAAAGILGFVAHWLKQPLMLMLIAFLHATWMPTLVVL